MTQFEYRCKSCGAKAINTHDGKGTLGTWSCECVKGKVPVVRTKTSEKDNVK